MRPVIRKPSWPVLYVALVAILVPFSSGCGGIFNHDKGVLRSPAAGENIGRITRCDYVLQAPYGRRIKLVFIDLVLKTPCCSCKHDFVELRDGKTANSSLIGRYCAYNLPQIVYSSTSELWIRFETDFRTYIENRFRLTYNTICGRHYTSLVERFTSPGYPHMYQADMECIYTIAVPRGRIKIEFEIFELEQRQTQTTACDFDFIEVKEIRYVEFGSQDSASRRRYCANHVPPIIYSTKGSYIWLRFKTDSSGQSTGFSATYRTVSVGEGSCNRRFSTPRGLMYSQNYPFPFPKNKECVWEIEVEKQKHIHLYFDTFNFSLSSQHCIYGHVRIYDGPGFVSQIGQFCGHHMPPKLVSRSNKLTVRAMSGDIHTGWFSARYMVSSEGPCGPKKFTCKNRQCIVGYLQCNGNQECKDGSDEVECPPKKETISWYSFWPVTVVIVMLIMGIWLWRTWRKFISPRRNIERHYCPSPCHHHSNGGISEVLEPPSYSEAILHQPQPPPSYEEAVATQNSTTVQTSDLEPTTGNGDVEGAGNACPNVSYSQDIDTHAVTIRTCGNHGNPVVGYHRHGDAGSSNHRQQDTSDTDTATPML